MTNDEALYEARRTCGAVADELRVGDEVLYDGFKGIICREVYYIHGEAFALNMNRALRAFSCLFTVAEYLLICLATTYDAIATGR